MFSLFQNIRRNRDHGRAGRSEWEYGFRSRQLSMERMEERVVLSATTAVDTFEGLSAVKLVSAVSTLRGPEGGWITLGVDDSVKPSNSVIEATDLNYVATFNLDIFRNSIHIVPSGVLAVGSLPAAYTNSVVLDAVFGGVFEYNAKDLHGRVAGYFSEDNLYGEVFVIGNSLGDFGSTSEMIRMPILGGSPPEGGEVPIDRIVGVEHKSILKAAAEFPAAVVLDPSAIPNRQEITGARARDIAFEVAYVGSRQGATSSELIRYSSNAQPTVAAQVGGPFGVREAESAWREELGATSCNSDSAESNAPTVAGRSSFRPVVSVADGRASGRDAELAEEMEARLTVVPHRDAAGINPVATLAEGDELEAELAAEAGTPIWERDHAIKPWHAVVTLVAATLAAERLSRRRTETELHPPR